ncbi:hypothetical protein LCGC14_2198610, partial [marine sediment metagenome]
MKKSLTLSVNIDGLKWYARLDTWIRNFINFLFWFIALSVIAFVLGIISSIFSGLGTGYFQKGYKLSISDHFLDFLFVGYAWFIIIVCVKMLNVYVKDISDFLAIKREEYYEREAKREKIKEQYCIDCGKSFESPITNQIKCMLCSGKLPHSKAYVGQIAKPSTKSSSVQLYEEALIKRESINCRWCKRIFLPYDNKNSLCGNCIESSKMYGNQLTKEKAIKYAQAQETGHGQMSLKDQLKRTYKLCQCCAGATRSKIRICINCDGSRDKACNPQHFPFPTNLCKGCSKKTIN